MMTSARIPSAKLLGTWTRRGSLDTSNMSLHLPVYSHISQSIQKPETLKHIFLYVGTWILRGSFRVSLGVKGLGF